MCSCPVNYIDHIIVRVVEPEPLFHLFADVFGLPVSWPLQRNDFVRFGWITLGNTNLEFWASADNRDLPRDVPLPLFHGFALDPSDLHAGIEMLAQHSITCKNPRPYITTNTAGKNVINYTNSVILDVSSDACCIFFCEWCADGTIFPWREKLTASQRRLREQAHFSACEGGNEIALSKEVTGRVDFRFAEISGMKMGLT